MSKIMENADAYKASFGVGLKVARELLQAEVTRVETELACLRKEAMVKHEYEEAAEFYAECGPGPDQLKSWIIDIRAKVTRMESELEAALKDRVALAHENETLSTRLAAIEAQEPCGDIYTIAGVQHCTLRGDLTDGSIYLAAGAKPALVPMTDDQIMRKWQVAPGTFMYGIVRTVEAHHKIGAKP